MKAVGSKAVQAAAVREVPLLATPAAARRVKPAAPAALTARPQGAVVVAQVLGARVGLGVMATTIPETARPRPHTEPVGVELVADSLEQGQAVAGLVGILRSCGKHKEMS
jgi:hypothetical protein